jgi:TolB protein
MLRVHRRFIEFRYTASHTASGKRRRAETLYEVARKRADLLKMSLVTAAAMLLAVCVLALVETTKMAGATSLPQNGKIVFARQTLDEGYIYTVDPDGSNLSRLGKAIGQPAWSPDGAKIAYNLHAQIWVMDADGSNKRKLPIHSGGMSFESPTWSADGTQLAFSTSTALLSTSSDIYTSDADGSDLTNLTKSPDVSESSPDFSPNGLQMCFSGGNFKTDFGINIMSSDGSNPTRLAGDRPLLTEFFCDWSPDGTKIAYTERSRSDSALGDVYVMNADGSGKINLSKSPEVDELDPSWSPDGTKLTFESDRDSPGDYDIYTMDANGSDVAQVTKNADVSDLDADWQPLTPKSRSMTVHPPDTGGLSLLLVASALLFSGGTLLYAGLRRSM